MAFKGKNDTGNQNPDLFTLNYSRMDLKKERNI